MDINLTIKPSTKMNSEEENNVIRIPELYRHDLNFQIGKDIFLKYKDNSIKNFQIDFAYKEDLLNPWSAYLTQHSFDNLKILKQNYITIGCDPEFFLIDTKTYTMSNASNYFRFNSDVGNDGFMGEFRPKYSDNENDVATNIMNLINRARNKLNTTKNGKDIMLYGVSYLDEFSGGYHIHFGLPKFLLISNSFNNKLLTQIVSILDYYIGIMAVLPEGTDDAQRRTNKAVSYGKPGAFKYNRMTMEYRTPGSHLLRHPILTKGIMAIGYLVMNDIIKNLIDNNLLIPDNIQQTINNLKQHYNIPPSIDIHDAICSPYIVKALNYLNDIKHKLTTMYLYKNKEQNITDYINVVENNIKFIGNIEFNWRNFYGEEQQKQMVLYKTPLKANNLGEGSILLEN